MREIIDRSIINIMKKLAKHYENESLRGKLVWQNLQLAQNVEFREAKQIPLGENILESFNNYPLKQRKHGSWSWRAASGERRLDEEILGTDGASLLASKHYIDRRPPGLSKLRLFAKLQKLSTNALPFRFRVWRAIWRLWLLLSIPCWTSRWTDGLKSSEFQLKTAPPSML